MSPVLYRLTAEPVGQIRAVAPGVVYILVLRVLCLVQEQLVPTVETGEEGKTGKDEADESQEHMRALALLL